MQMEHLAKAARDRAVVGGPSARGGAGAAWLFRRTAAAWKLSARWRGTTGAGLGYGVALSADGRTAALGAPNEGGGTGAVWIKR